MWMTDERIYVISKELKKLITVECSRTDRIFYKEGLFFTPGEADTDGGNWQEFLPEKMKWYGPDRHYWFRTDYTIPEKYAGKRLELFVKTNIEDSDDGRNPQFLLFVNGDVTQGLDMNHKTVKMTDSAMSGMRWEFDLQAYTGTLHSEFDMIIGIRQTDPVIEKLYYDLLVPLQAFNRMEKDDLNRIKIEQILNEAVNLIDLRSPYSKAFYESVHDADAILEKKLYTDMAGWDDVTATCIGHTHIDVAWRWTVDQTREKAARSFATVLKLMDEYPDYKFMSSQPQLYEFVKERYPGMYECIKERVKEGRWDPEGGMWLEADTNLTSGESLVRQFLYGRRFFKDEFGVDSKILWLPDVFGYSGALPQIMKKSGIEYFMTTKLAWNQLDKMPNDTFLWKGIDGSEVLTHMITTVDVCQSEDNYFTTYNGMLHPDSIIGGWKRYQNKDINNDILVSYGYGDGGGGPTREMLETSVRMKKGIRGIPKVRQEKTAVYFDELNERVKDNPRLPVWEGELYFEFHRGTYTSMARNKRSNRKSEIMMMNLEFLSVLGNFAGVPAEKKRMDALWKRILLNQFHDILPGSGIREVYEVTDKDYEWVEKESNRMLGHRLEAVAGKGENITLFNTLSFERNDIVYLSDETSSLSKPGDFAKSDGGEKTKEDPCIYYSGKSLADENGKHYPIQCVRGKSVAYVESVPSKGWKSYKIVETESPDKCPFILDGNCLRTPFYVISFDDMGLFTSVYDKENDREVLQNGKKANLFRMYEDKPANYDNWNIDVYYSEKSWDADKPARMEWTLGPVCAVLETERTISNSLINQRIYFYADIRRIDFETQVIWKEHQHLLKVLFPVDVHTDEASFDIQFGNLTRKVHTNTSWDMARFESCGHKWMDLSEGHYGVSLLNDCKYGHSVKDSVMALTLIKSGIDPNPEADQGEHIFTYSLYPHYGNLYECYTVQQGYCLNVPFLVKAGSALMHADSFLQIDKKNVIAETVKPAEDGRGIILRIYEYENSRTYARITFGCGITIAAVQECNLMEENEGEPLKHTADSFEFCIRPYEIKTYRVDINSSTSSRLGSDV